MKEEDEGKLMGQVVKIDEAPESGIIWARWFAARSRRP